jgi:predicted metalloprotease
LAVAVVGALVALAACATSGDKISSDRISSGGRGGEDNTTTTTRKKAPTTTIDPKVQEFADELKSVGDLLNQFWSDQFSDQSGDTSYTEPAKVVTWVGSQDDPPTCGGDEVEAENAFFCGADNDVIIDVEWLYDEYTKIGDTFLYVVLAHEWGHSVQDNTGQPDDERDAELQADCFAGTWIQSTIDDGTVTLEEGDEEEMNQTLAFISNEYGSTESHGTLAQRARAFEFGRSSAPEACLDVRTYIDWGGGTDNGGGNGNGGGNEDGYQCDVCTTDGEQALYDTMPEIFLDRCDPGTITDVWDGAGADQVDGVFQCRFTYDGQPIKADYLHFTSYAGLEALYEAVANNFGASTQEWDEGDGQRVGLYTTFDETKAGGVLWHDLIFTYDTLNTLVWTYTEADPSVIEAWWQQLPSAV